MRTDRALKLVDRLIKISPDPGLTRHARRMRAKLLMTPMPEILKKVPGVTLASKARFLGVRKETVHGWARGKWRPNEVQAKKLARVTGIPYDLIRGGDLAQQTQRQRI